MTNVATKHTRRPRTGALRARLRRPDLASRHLCRGRREAALARLCSPDRLARIRPGAGPLPVVGGRTAERRSINRFERWRGSGSTSATRCTTRWNKGSKWVAITGPIFPVDLLSHRHRHRGRHPGRDLFAPAGRSGDVQARLCRGQPLGGDRRTAAGIQHGAQLAQVARPPAPISASSSRCSTRGASSRSFSGRSISFWSGRRSTWRSVWVCCIKRRTGPIATVDAGTVRRYRAG